MDAEPPLVSQNIGLASNDHNTRPSSANNDLNSEKRLSKACERILSLQGITELPPSQISRGHRDVLLDALKVALASPGEHRLFRSGKIPGLFKSRGGLSGEAALFALKQGLLECIRTEVRGKVVTEWVKATPHAVTYVHSHDSSRSILRELSTLLQDAREGIPSWLSEAERQIGSLTVHLQQCCDAMLQKLESLSHRVDAALRRVELQRPDVTEQITESIPWASAALEYLDRRLQAGAPRECPLRELYQSVCLVADNLGVAQFQEGLRRLHDLQAVELVATMSEIDDPEYAFVVAGRIIDRVRR